MIVISDTTCLSTLIQTGDLDILKKLYGEIIIPPKVYDELMLLSVEGFNIKTITSLIWIKIQNPISLSISEQFIMPLDAGETQAIALAIELSADYIILDEHKGRLVARNLNLPVIGLGGVLIQAKSIGLIPSVKVFLLKIKEKTGFYLSQAAYEIILNGANEIP